MKYFNWRRSTAQTPRYKSCMDETKKNIGLLTLPGREYSHTEKQQDGNLQGCESLCHSDSGWIRRGRFTENGGGKSPHPTSCRGRTFPLVVRPLYQLPLFPH